MREIRVDIFDEEWDDMQELIDELIASIGTACNSYFNTYSVSEEDI